MLTIPLDRGSSYPGLLEESSQELEFCLVLCRILLKLLVAQVDGLRSDRDVIFRKRILGLHFVLLLADISVFDLGHIGYHRHIRLENITGRLSRK